VQIRTQQMHSIAETGVASHWMYKTSEDLSGVQQRTHQWLQSVLDIQSTSGDAAEFLEHIKVDLFPDEVYVFTPKGKILSMPRGATPVDLAYAVHTDIGNRCIAARVNYELVPLRTELQNGDRVEIITAPNAHPNPGWLSYVKTAKARSQIRHFLKTTQVEESVSLGERLLNQALRALGTRLADVPPDRWDRLMRETNAKTRSAMLADIGVGRRLAAIVARKLLALSEGVKDARPAGSIIIRGSEGMAVQFSQCCSPIPGDPIVGFMKKGEGLVIHTNNCKSVRGARGDSGKWVDVEWDTKLERMFDVNMKIVVLDQRGVLAKVATAIADAGCNISNVSVDEDHGMYATNRITMQVTDRHHLARVVRSLRRIPEVVRISRAPD
jgi:GTP pyrophosphokinase